MTGAKKKIRHAHLSTHIHIQGQTWLGQKDVPRLSVKAEHHGLAVTTQAQSKVYLIKVGSIQFCSHPISHKINFSPD